MSLYTRRLQTMLTEDQYELLSKLSSQSGKAISVLIREAIEKAYFEQVERDRRRAALNRLLAMNAPVADWDQMKAEIIQGALGE